MEIRDNQDADWMAQLLAGNVDISGEPFVVYGVDSPTYPEVLIGDCGSQAGETAPNFFTGSIVVISGGVMKRDEESNILVFKDGLSLHLSSGRRFVQQIVASLIEETARVTIAYVMEDAKENSEQRDSAIARGLDVLDSSEGRVFVGRGGSSLRGWDWFEGEWWSFLGGIAIASDGPEGDYQARLAQAARSNGSLKEVVSEFWSKMEQFPQLFASEISGYQLTAHLDGPDGNNLVITRSATDTSAIHLVMSRAAREFDIPLFYAGSLSEPDEEGHRFTEFADFVRWRPLPEHWKRIE